MGKVATSPLPPWGSPPLQSGGQNQKCRIHGQAGYITPAASGIPTASQRGAKSEVAHKWARWLHQPCCIGDPHRFKVGGKIRSGPYMGKVATSPMPPPGSPPLQSGGQNQKSAHQWARWLHHPCRLGDPHRFRAGGKVRSGPYMGKVATSPLPPRGSPPLQSGVKIRSRPIHGQGGYITPAASGIPTALEHGAKSEVAHKWARWLHHPCCLGDPHRFKVGGKIRSGPYMGKVATSGLPPRGSPPLQSGGQNQKSAHQWARWLHHPCRLAEPHRFRAGGKIRSGPYMGKVATSPLPARGSPPLQSGVKIISRPTSGQGGYVTPAASGIPTASERGVKSEVAHTWARWLHHPCRLGDPHRYKAGGKIRSRPTSGQGGYITPAASGIPTASERGVKSELAHTWARWLHHPCRLGDPHRFRTGGKIRSGPYMGKVATSPLPPWGSPPLQSGGQNQKCRIHGQGGYITPAASGIPTASQRGAKSEVAHKWTRWLHHPCCIGDPHRFKVGGKIRSGQYMGKVAT